MTPDDLVLYLSGGADNSDGRLSFGGSCSTTPVPSSLESVFDSVGPEGCCDFRCFYVANNHPTETLYGARVRFGECALPKLVFTELGAGGAVAPRHAHARVEPATVMFGSEALVGDLAPGERRAVWVKRMVLAGAPSMGGAKVTLIVEGDA